MTPGSAAEQVRRDGLWTFWAPSGRAAVPAIVLLVIVANLVGVATVVLLLVGIQDGSGSTGRSPVLLVVAAYLAVALPVGIVAGLRRQRTTNRWLMAGREPTSEEAGQALRLPVDTALIAGLIWLAGAVVVAVASAAAFPDPLVGLRTGIATLLGGLATAGVTYLLVARAARAVTAIALAAHPPAGALTLGVRPRLLFTWGLTSGVPMLGVVLPRCACSGPPTTTPTRQAPLSGPPAASATRSVRRGRSTSAWVSPAAGCGPARSVRPAGWSTR
jgi:hypothetical protein